MNLTQQNRDRILVLTLVLLCVLLLVCLTLALKLPPQNQTTLEKEITIQGVKTLSKIDLCYQAASSTLNDSFIKDNEFAAISVWNKLNKKGISCTLLVGNLSLSNESITQCNSVWVVAEDVAIDDGILYTDSQHMEGYSISSPLKYAELKDALDDYYEAKTRYLSSVNAYNSLPTEATKNSVDSAKSDYIDANKNLILAIS